MPRGLGLTQPFHYTEYLDHRLFEVVVDDFEVRKLTTLTELEPTFVDASLDMVFRITSTSEPSCLDLLRGRRQEDHPGLRHDIDHLSSAIELDLEHDVAPARRGGDRRAIEMTEELGPFQEASTFDVGLKA